jgi:hypothetical protein
MKKNIAMVLSGGRDGAQKHIGLIKRGKVPFNALRDSNLSFT